MLVHKIISLCFRILMNIFYITPYKQAHISLTKIHGKTQVEELRFKNWARSWIARPRISTVLIVYTKKCIWKRFLNETKSTGRILFNIWIILFLWIFVFIDHVFRFCFLSIAQCYILNIFINTLDCTIHKQQENIWVVIIGCK